MLIYDIPVTIPGSKPRTVGYNIHPDLSERQKNYKYVAEACETAERVGCSMVTTHAGTRSAEHQIAPHKDNWTWETWKMVVDSFKQILKDTAGMKVALGVEAVNMTCMNNPKAHLQLIEDVGDPRIQSLPRSCKHDQSQKLFQNY